MAERWTDSNGFTWSFTVNGTEATDIKLSGSPDSERIYIYGDPNNPTQGPVTLQPGDGAAGRFSYNEGRYFPTISDEVYLGYKTLVFEIIETTKGQFIWGEGSDMCTMRVMNGWWSTFYTDDVPMSVGLWELPITEAIAYDCAQSGRGYDLNLLMTAGTITIKSVYYESYTVSGAVVIPEKVYAGSTELTVTSIGDYAFKGSSNLTSLTIPKSVTSIGDYAFSYCSSLTSLAIPESVTSIGERAFESCYGLTSLTIPESVTSIGKFAFDYCYGLTSVTIPSNVTSIVDGVFNGCFGLTSVTIPESVTSIGDHAFAGCYGLTSVTIPSNVTSIGNQAFAGCSGLTSLTIPSSVTSIDEWAFNNCYGLTSISVESGNSVYDSRNNCNAIIETATNTLIAGCKNTIIPPSVTSIGNYAFFNRPSLTSVTIPESVTSIGKYAFDYCSGLTSVTIPESVTSIGDRAFYGCSGLTTVTSLIEEPFEIGPEVFTYLNNETYYYEFTTATLYVPAGTKEKYEATAGWNLFQNIVEMGLTPVGNDEPINIVNEIDEDTDLDGNVVGDIFYNISSGDGSYDPVEGCIIVSKATDDNAIDGKDIFGEDFKDNFTGVVFKVSEGKGSIKVKAETTGNMVMKVKIGDGEPLVIVFEGMTEMSFPYNVSEETLVYIYGGMKSAGAKATGARHAPSDADLLKIYGIEVVSDASGIEAIENGQQVNDDVPVYNLNGQRVSTPAKGIYIKNRKKVLVN